MKHTKNKTIESLNLNRSEDVQKYLHKIHKTEFPPEMKGILKTYTQDKKNIKINHWDQGNVVHVIIKDIKVDRKLQALTIARRLLYCCPLHKEN
jgi:hypothetical protein